VTDAPLPVPPFQPVVVPVDGEGPSGVVAIDADADGRDDVVVVLANEDEVMLLRGGGAGAPARGPRFATGDGPHSLLAGDVDGDGTGDLVVVNFNSADLSILLGRPEGGFRPEHRQTFLPGAIRDDLDAGAFHSLALADFDRDGWNDLVVAHRQGLALLRGHGDGSFTVLGQIQAGDLPFSVVAGDFDADGHIDLVTSNIASDDIVFLRGHGDGTFEALSGVPAGISPRGLAAGDLDGDGVLDLVTGNQYSGDPLDSYAGDVSVLLGLGDGGFRPAVRYRTGRVSTWVALGDFDEDGVPDIAAANAVSGDVSVLLGAGDGTFGAPSTVRIGVSPSGLLVLDRNDDGHLDLVSTGPAGIAFVEGTGDGGFLTHATHPLIVEPTRVAAADLNGDGRQDLIVAGRERHLETADVAILPGRGGGGFDAPVNLDITAFSNGLSDIAVADFNDDGQGDYAVADGSRLVGIVIGRGRWEYGPATWINTGWSPLALASADFNGDGWPDLAVAHHSEDGVLILLGRGDGGFEPGTRLPATDSFHDVVADDLDGDGRIDLAVFGTEYTLAAGYRAIAEVYGGKGDGLFDGPVVLGLADEPYAAAGGDINGDGLVDLVVASWFGITPLINRGGLDFTLGVLSPARSMIDIVTADFTRDGIADAAVLSLQLEVVSVFPGAADGTLGQEERSVGGRAVVGFAAGDFDGDGAPDLVTANRGLRDAFVGSRPDVSVLLNRAQAPNQAPIAVAQAPAVVECASWSGATLRLDGTASHDPDAASGGTDESMEFTWYENYGAPTQVALGSGAVADVTLGLGGHEITLLVTDRTGASATAALVIIVQDTTPPSLALALSSPGILWPPDHRLADVVVAATYHDKCGPVEVELRSVTSSEPDDVPGEGDGRTTGDVTGTEIGRADFELGLRAEREASGPGRTYTAGYRARDAQGLWTEAAITIVVPHDVRSASDIPASRRQ
jgi:hypothetical protein